MFYRLVFALLLAGAVMALPLTLPLAAKECGPLKMIASTDLVPFDDLHLLPMTVNGQQMHFLLDTGGVYTQIGETAANRAGLSIQYGATEVVNAGGTTSGRYAKVGSLSMGGITGTDLYLRISPSEVPGDGLMALDVLRQSDVELDFAKKKINYFLPDHCRGKVIYWPHGDVAMVRISLWGDQWIKVPVTLDGKKFTAIIDTGASHTVMSRQTAKEYFNLTETSPGMEPGGNVNDDPRLPSHRYRFSSLSLDGVTMKNPRIVIIPDKWNEMSGRMELPEITLGMDLLKNLHLYFAFEERSLYITAAVPPAASPAPVDANPPPAAPSP
jgi:predicted aspartyl protease